MEPKSIEFRTFIVIQVSGPILSTIKNSASQRFSLGENVAEMRFVKGGEHTRHGAGLKGGKRMSDNRQHILDREEEKVNRIQDKVDSRVYKRR